MAAIPSAAHEGLVRAVAVALAGDSGRDPKEFVDEARKHVVAFDAIREHLRMTGKQF